MSGKKAKRKRKAQNQSKKTKSSNKKRTTAIWIVTVLIFALIGTIGHNLIPDKKPNKHNKYLQANSNKSIFSCIKSPVFPLKYGLKPPYAIDLRQNNESMGLKIMEVKTGKSIQLPGWRKFGYLGLYTLDNLGNIFTSPLPYVSIDINPPKEQNKILKVDSKTGTMKEFMNLPSVNPPSPKNPFGVIGLVFDCETQSLYVSSVAGSTFNKETGKIFQINPTKREILNTFDNHDIMGLAIFRGINGKRLYMGLARKPEIWSVGLNKSGGFNNDFRFEFSLKDVPGGGNLKAHRLRIKNNRMTLKAREFSYTLIAASSPLRTIYTFDYNRDNDKWDFVELHQEGN